MEFNFNTLVFILFVIYSIAQALLADKKRKEKLAQANESPAHDTLEHHEETPLKGWRALVQEIDHAIEQEWAAIEHQQETAPVQSAPKRTQTTKPAITSTEFRSVTSNNWDSMMSNVNIAEEHDIMNREITVTELEQSHAHDALFNASSLDIRDFKRGIIMKEILDRPLSLRKHTNGHA